MFPRAARFNRDRFSDTPGPNSYDPTEMVAHYKKGLLNQKDARFRVNQHHESDDGGSTSASAIVLTPSRKVVASASTSKEKAAMASKLSTLEEKVCNLQRQVRSLTTEKSQSMAELRISQQQVEKLQAILSKTKGQASKNDTMQAKAAELQRIHDQNRLKQRSEAERWEAKFTTLQAEKKQTELDRTKTKELLSASEKEVQSLRKGEAELRRQLAVEREGRRLAEEESESALRRLKEREVVMQRLQDERNTLMNSSESLQLLIEEEQETIEEKTRQRSALEKVARRSALQVNKLQGEFQDLSLNHSLERIENRRLRVRLESRDMEVAWYKETISGLREDLESERILCEEAWMQLDDVFVQRNSEVADEEPVIYFDEWVDHKTLLLETCETLRRVSQSALQDETERSGKLQGELDSLNQRYLDTMKENLFLQETQQALDKVRQELDSVEEAYEKTLLELMRAHKKEEEVKKDLIQSRADYDALAVRLRQVEKMSKKVSNAKMKEEAWLQEREQLLQELDRTSHYEAEYHSLRSQAQLLISKSNSYELQMEELSSFNTVLASHTNPSQKIYYLDRIRKELDEKRSDCQVLQVERDEMKEKCKNLQERLDIFCKVDSRLEDRPRTTFKRVARQSSNNHHHHQSNSNVLAEKSTNVKSSSPVKVESKSRFRKQVEAFGWFNGSQFIEEADMTLDELMVSM